MPETKLCVSIPERVLEALKQMLKDHASYSEVCVSIPERVLEALKPKLPVFEDAIATKFQSLKGF